MIILGVLFWFVFSPIVLLFSMESIYWTWMRIFWNIWGIFTNVYIFYTHAQYFMRVIYWWHHFKLPSWKWWRRIFWLYNTFENPKRQLLFWTTNRLWQSCKRKFWNCQFIKSSTSLPGQKENTVTSSRVRGVTSIETTTPVVYTSYCNEAHFVCSLQSILTSKKFTSWLESHGRRSVCAIEQHQDGWDKWEKKVMGMISCGFTSCLFGWLCLLVHAVIHVMTEANQIYFFCKLI